MSARPPRSTHLKGPAKKGFSIAESLIACTLISGIAVALFGVWAMHSRATANSREHIVATALAEELIEEQLSLGYTSKSHFPATAADRPNYTFEVKHIVEGVDSIQQYIYGIYIQEQASPNNPGLKLVDVQVAWEHSGNWRTTRLVTQLSWQQ